MQRTSMYARNIPTAWRMLLTAETNTKKLPVGCGAAEAPGPALDSTAKQQFVVRNGCCELDVVRDDWRCKFVQLNLTDMSRTGH